MKACRVSEHAMAQHTEVCARIGGEEGASGVHTARHGANGRERTTVCYCVARACARATTSTACVVLRWCAESRGDTPCCVVCMHVMSRAHAHAAPHGGGERANMAFIGHRVARTVHACV